MSQKNITQYQNETIFDNVKTELPGFSFLQTIFLILCVVSSIILFSTAVFYVVRRKSLNELRHRLVPIYHFDPGECDDWEDELLDDRKDRTKNTLQFYRSMSSPTVTTSL